MLEESFAADVFAYPATFTEVYCISLIKAMAAGAYPVTSDCGVLADFNRWGESVRYDPTRIDEFVSVYRDALVDVLGRGEPPYRKQMMRVRPGTRSPGRVPPTGQTNSAGRLTRPRRQGAALAGHRRQRIFGQSEHRHHRVGDFVLRVRLDECVPGGPARIPAAQGPGCPADIAAGAVGVSTQRASVVDVGANVGDTAAILASAASARSSSSSRVTTSTSYSWRHAAKIPT